MSKTVLFQTIQFSISTQFSFILPIDRTLWGTTTLGKSWHGIDANEGTLRITQNSCITRTSASDCLMSYQDTRSGVLPLWRQIKIKDPRMINHLKAYGTWCI